MEILVVGAGPTGLTAANELIRQGKSVKIIEKRASGSGLSRAVGILPESIQLLEPSGISERLLSDGVILASVKFYLEDKQALSLEVLGDDPQRDFVLALAQDRTEAIMRDAIEAAGGDVQFGTELTSLQQSDNRVLAGFADGSKAWFDYVIGADGIGSTTRILTGIDFPGFDLPETWSIADVEAKNWPHKGSFVVCRKSGGQVAVVAQLEEDRFRVISNTDDALTTLPLDLDVVEIRRQGTFKVSVRQVEQYQKGRVFLAGDAAHCHSPVGGRGMNLGISDAVELAARIVNRSTDAYTLSRHTYGHSVIGTSERGRRLVTSRSPLATLALRSLFAVAKRSQTVRQRMAMTFLYG